MKFFKTPNPIQYFCLFFILLGIMLRVDYFMEDRSLRVDEAAYFDYLVFRTPPEVLLNKNYSIESPTAPVGFSFVEKSFIDNFGYNEKVLRFIPLLLSIAGVLLFYFLISQYSLSWAAPLGLGLFAVADRFIFYSADMHPYASEIFFAILVLWMFNDLESKGYLPKARARFMVTAVLSVWFSFTVVFILGAMALTSLLGALLKKDWEHVHRLLITHAFWFLSFLFVYKWTIYPIIQSGFTHDMWVGYFIKGPRSLPNVIHWLFKTFWEMFKDPLGIVFPAAGVILFLAGAAVLFCKDRKQLYLLSAFFILPLGAALFKLYPFTGRVILFLMPSLLIFISLGAEAIMNFFKGKAKLLWLVLFIGILFLLPVKQTLGYFIDGWDSDGARAAVCYFKDNIQPEDIVLMSTESRYEYIYYMHYVFRDNKPRWLGRIWDDVFKDPSGGQPNARCIFEQLRYDEKGFVVGVIRNKNKPIYWIFSNKWLKVSYKREWLLLISPSEELRKFLEQSLRTEQGDIKETRFKGAYLYLLEKK